MTPLPIVAFSNIILCESTIRHMVGVSRTVARWNGNRSRRPVALITDDFSLARDAMTVEDQRYNSRHTLAQENSALFWPDSGIIWIEPRTTSISTVRSLAHEVAHSCTRGHHAFTWRRMFAMLLPLWWRAFGVNYGMHDLKFEIDYIVLKHAAQRMTPDRQREEVRQHMIAADRATTRWAHLIR